MILMRSFYKISLFLVFIFTLLSANSYAQTVSEIQKQNARATGYAIVASRNPGKNISIIVIPWDGTNTLEYNANNQINSLWHAQAAIKGNFFNQTFDGVDFTSYSSVVVSQADFDLYKHTGSQWWIVCSYLQPFSNSGITVSATDNVGIGTITPNEKLSVNGKIRAHEVKVETANWPDYVFEPDYKLPSLTEIEAYIQKNKHLPEMPSAAQLTDKGLELGEMVKIQQKKIEELTLYLIEKNKEMDKERGRITLLEGLVKEIIKKN